MKVPPFELQTAIPDAAVVLGPGICVSDHPNFVFAALQTNMTLTYSRRRVWNYGAVTELATPAARIYMKFKQGGARGGVTFDA